MLKGNMEIYFENENKKGWNFYYTSEVKSLTFKFSENVYLLGFIKINNIDKFYFYEKYIVEAIFPSFDNSIYLESSINLKDDSVFPICLGCKVIGRGKLLRWEYIE